MAIYLKVKAGPDAGKTVEMQEGVTLGRSSNANFTFQDPKMSGRHVKVVKSGNELMLVDMGSKNGFRIDGRKTTNTPFISGSSLRIGNTDFEVIVEGDGEIELIDGPPEPPKTPLKPRSSPAPTPPKLSPLPRVDSDAPTEKVEIDLATIVAEPPKPKPERPKWHEYFVQFVLSSVSKIKSKPRELRPFRRLVKLSVISGIQTETAWTLGYGPRLIGPQSCDVVIEDPGAPPICFSVTPDSDSVVFSTERPDVVRLNDRTVRTDTLKEGDVISFANTSIQFGFSE